MLTQEQLKNSKHHIIVRYPPLAGGSFIRVFLSYYESALLGVLANIYGVNEETLPIDRYKDYAHKLITMLFIPPEGFEDLWTFARMPEKEGRFGLSNLTTSNYWTNVKVSFEEYYTNLNDYHKIMWEKYYYFHRTHVGTYDELTGIFPNATILNLVDYEEMQKISEKFKFGHEQSDRHIGHKCIGPNVINFSMKDLFNKEKFFAYCDSIALQIFGNCDVDPRREEFYDAYIAVHNR